MLKGETTERVANQFINAVDLHKQGKLDSAIPIYREILSSNPDHIESLINLGQALSRSEDKEDISIAIDCYEKALKQPGCPGVAHYNLGNLYQRSNRLEEAVNSYNQALSDNEEMHLAWYQLGNIHQKQGQLDKAISDLDKAIELSEDNPAYFYRRAFCHYQKEEYQKVVVDAVTALTLSPENPVAVQSLLGQAYYHTENYNRAVIHFGLARRFEPSNPGHLMDLGAALRLAGKVKESDLMIGLAKKLMSDTKSEAN